MAVRNVYKRIRVAKAIGVVLVALAMPIASAWAAGAPQGPPRVPPVSGWSTESIIGGGAVSDFSGVAGINMAAGHENLQSNAAAIVLGDSHGKGLAKVHSSQSLLLGSGSLPESSRARISDGAFAHGAGVFSINQASGLGNAQANGITIGVGRSIRPMSDLQLGQSVAMPSGMREKMQGGSGHREAIVGKQTFSGTRGIVQLNQAAGTGNATANGFSLNVGVGVR